MQNTDGILSSDGLVMSYAQSVEITNRYSQARNYSAVEERNLSNSCVGGGGRGGGRRGVEFSP